MWRQHHFLALVEHSVNPPSGSNDTSATDGIITAALRDVRLLESAPAVTGGSSLSFGVGEDEAAPPIELPGYTLVRVIHRGGQGVVYQAIHNASSRGVAIKVLRDGGHSNPRDRLRFEQEVQILRELKHPALVALEDRGTLAGRQFLVMPYIEGRPLDQYLAEEGLSVRQTLELFARICDAVNAAHLNGVIHRDLKPGNILIDDSGEVHVVDFGLAKLTPEFFALSAGESQTGAQAPTLTQPGQFIGSLPWVSPEQAEGRSRMIDVRTDVYSLGVILFYMLAGELPFDTHGSVREVLNRIVSAEPRRLRTLRRGIPVEVETIVAKCLARDRERRYQSAGEIGRDVRHYLAGEPISARPPGAWARAIWWARRHPVLTTTAACVCVAILSLGGTAAVVGYLWSRPHSMFRSPDERSAWLLSVAGNVIHDWDGRAPGTITFAELVPRPRELDGELLAIVGFTERYTGPDAENRRGAICAFAADDGWSAPVWTHSIGAVDSVPQYTAGCTGEDFPFRSAWIDDVLADSPGDEIAVAFKHYAYTYTILRVYDLAGGLHFEMWSRAEIQDVLAARDEAGRALLVCAGSRNIPGFDQPGGETSSEAVKVVFAVRPDCAFRDLDSTSDAGAAQSAWYKYVSPEPERRAIGGAIRLERPIRTGQRATARIDIVGQDPGVSVSWQIDALGDELPGTRVTSNGFRRRRSADPHGFPAAEDVGLSDHAPVFGRR